MTVTGWAVLNAYNQIPYRRYFFLKTSQKKYPVKPSESTEIMVGFCGAGRYIMIPGEDYKAARGNLRKGLIAVGPSGCIGNPKP